MHVSQATSIKQVTLWTLVHGPPYLYAADYAFRQRVGWEIVKGQFKELFLGISA